MVEANSSLSPVKQAISDFIDERKASVFEISRCIHERPEMAFEEFFASELLTDFLAKEGFSLQKGVAGLGTSFVAKYGDGKGPKVAILAEYDALSLGHACGHNIIAATAVGAAAAMKYAVSRFSLSGELYVIGTPAEESGGGKVVMLEQGVFDGIDALLLLHPTTGMTKVAGRCKSSYQIDVEYFGEKAHASSHPEDGINATDSAVNCYVGIGMMRQQLMPGVSVMSLIMEPNRDDGFIPDHSWVRVKIRAFSERAIADAVKKLKCCIKAAADAAGCCFKLTEKAGYKGRVVNKTIGDLLHANLNLLKEPTMEGYVDDNGGEDFGNLSRVIPGMMVYPTLYPEKKLSNHTEFFMELANSDRSKHVLLLGSKVLAFTAVDLLCSVDIIKQAKRELSLLMESGES